MNRKDYFIQLGEKCINFEHVTNITYDYPNDKVIINLDYPIKIKVPYDRCISRDVRHNDSNVDNSVNPLGVGHIGDVVEPETSSIQQTQQPQNNQSNQSNQSNQPKLKLNRQGQNQGQRLNRFSNKQVFNVGKGKGDIKSNKPKIPKTAQKTVSDYVYVQGIQEVQEKLKQSQYVQGNFFKKGLQGEAGYVNIHAVSLFKFDSDRNRVIINLSNSVSLFDKVTNAADIDRNNDVVIQLKNGTKYREMLTSEFIYVDFVSDSEYNEYRDYINMVLNSED